MLNGELLASGVAGSLQSKWRSGGAEDSGAGQHVSGPGKRLPLHACFRLAVSETLLHHVPVILVPSDKIHVFSRTISA